jgi:hypothetical protein
LRGIFGVVVVEVPRVTLERKLLVSLSDIKSLCFECRQCGSKFFRTERARCDVPAMCQGCGNNFRAGEDSPSVKLVKVLSALQQGSDAGFRILLEIDEPPNDSTT